MGPMGHMLEPMGHGHIPEPMVWGSSGVLHAPSLPRRDVNHIHQLLTYARKIFYNIDTTHAVNTEAEKLWVYNSGRQ